jgi:hypothetical protein
VLVAATAFAPSRHAAGATSGPRRTTLVGVVRAISADTVADQGRDDVIRQELLVGDRSYALRGPSLPANATMRVTGELRGRHLDVVRAQQLQAASSQLLPTTGTTRVLVMLAYWTAPDSVTPGYAYHQIFGDTSAWYRDASYGQLDQRGDVTPWMRIAGPADGRCYGDHAATMAQARSAAAALGYDVASYDNFVLYFPNANLEPGSDCGSYAGWGYIGAPGVWLNGFIDRRVTVHEQGHNYGLSHSHSNLCTQVITGTCTFDEYGDVYDAMGSSPYVGHFSASQKALLGWLDGRMVDLSGGGVAALAPMAADATGPHAIRIGTRTDRVYWIEYRQPVDFDRDLPVEGLDGVQIRVAGDGSGGRDAGASLLDVRPGDGLSVYSATLRSGATWRSPEGIEVSVGPVTAGSAEVRVRVGAAAEDRELPDVAVAPTTSLVVWQQQDGASTDIAAERIGPGGAPLDPEPITVSAAAGGQSQPAVAWNGSTFLVTWTDTRAGSADIYGARVRADGTVLDPGGRPISTAPGDQRWSAVRALGSTWLVAWQDRRSGTSTDVYATRVVANGAPVDPAGVAVSTAARDQLRPAVAAGDRGWYVTWADRRDGPRTGTDVYGTRVSGTARPASTSGTPISRARGDQWSPAVSWNGRCYLVVWADERTGNGTDVFGARVGPGGAVADPAGIAIAQRAGTQVEPAVTASASRFLVVWSDDRSTTSDDIYGTFVGAAGAVSDRDCFAISTAAGDQQHPALGALDGASLATWSDRRSGAGSNIYATRIDAAGNVSRYGGFKLAA